RRMRYVDLAFLDRVTTCLPKKATPTPTTNKTPRMISTGIRASEIATSVATRQRKTPLPHSTHTPATATTQNTKLEANTANTFRLGLVDLVTADGIDIYTPTKLRSGIAVLVVVGRNVPIGTILLDL